MKTPMAARRGKGKKKPLGRWISFNFIFNDDKFAPGIYLNIQLMRKLNEHFLSLRLMITCCSSRHVLKHTHANTHTVHYPAVHVSALLRAVFCSVEGHCHLAERCPSAPVKRHLVSAVKLAENSPGNGERYGSWREKGGQMLSALPETRWLSVLLRVFLGKVVFDQNIDLQNKENAWMYYILFLHVWPKTLAFSPRIWE